MVKKKKDTLVQATLFDARNVQFIEQLVMTVESLRARAHEDFAQERIQKISPSLLVSLRTFDTP